MHASLPIEEPLGILDGKNALMPDIRVNIETPAAVAPECHDPSGVDIVTGQRDRDDKGFPVDRMEELTAVRMTGTSPAATRR